MTTNSKKDFLQEFECAKEIALEVGSFLKQQNTKAIDTQEDKDIKLALDKISETKILNNLAKYEYTILSEENGLSGEIESNTPIWIIDPIDGTLNYSRDNPSSCISIALYKGSNPVFGVIYDFNRDELFSGYVGIGAWLNDNPILKKETIAISQAILATGFPTYLEHDSITLNKFIANIQKYKKIRMIGSAALSLAYVATGRFDTYMENSIKLWDVAAGIAINKAIGNEVSSSLYENFLMNVKVGIFKNVE